MVRLEFLNPRDTVGIQSMSCTNSLELIVGQELWTLSYNHSSSESVAIMNIAKTLVPIKNYEEAGVSSTNSDSV